MTPQDASKAYLDKINRLDVHIGIYKGELTLTYKLQTEYNNAPELNALLKRRRNKYARDLDKAQRQRQSIIDQIDALEDPTSREILKSIYIKHQKIYAIADRLYYGVSTIHKKQADALAEFYDKHLADSPNQ